MRNARWPAVSVTHARGSEMSGSFFGETIEVIPLPYETFLTGFFTAHKKISLRKERQRSGQSGTILTGKRSSFEGLRESALRIHRKPMRTFSRCGMARSMPLPAQDGSK